MCLTSRGVIPSGKSGDDVGFVARNAVSTRKKPPRLTEAASLSLDVFLVELVFQAARTSRKKASTCDFSVSPLRDSSDAEATT